VATTDLVRRLAAEPAHAALLLDVDGTLAPIVARPEDASVPPATRAELGRLHGRYGLVACVSGRPAADAERIVGVPGLRYVGEHGLELDPAAAEWAAAIAAFADSVAWPAERKPLTVSFHYRTAPDRQEAELVLGAVAERARAEGLVPRWGRMVLEIRPPLETDKGTAVRALLAGARLRRALYAGDDTTDLDAFRALDGLELGVRVAVVTPEAPALLRGAADVVVGGPAELLELLRAL
jgi:trehalose 6-phosphate phosphatase